MTTGKQKQKLDFSLETKDEAEKTGGLHHQLSTTLHTRSKDDDKDKTQRKPKGMERWRR
jgi:hypothetical protein